MSIKILHVGSKVYPPNYGGVEKIVFDIVTGARAFESFALVDNNLDERGTVAIKRKSGFFSSFLQILEICKEKDIDIVHLHKETSIPVGMLLRIFRIKCVLTIHGFGWRVPRWSLLQKSILWILDCFSYISFNRVAFCSPNDYSCVNSYLKSRRLVCVPNGVEVNSEKSSVDLRRGGVYLGRISPEKNIVSLVSAANRAGLSLVVYGPIDERDPVFYSEIKSLIDSGQMVWGGVVPHDKVRTVLRKYAVLLNVSFSEGLPVSVLEGASEGLHLVLSSIPAHKALAFPDVTFVDPNKVELSGVCAESTVASGSNIHHAQEFYSMDAMISGYSRIYLEVANEG